MAAQRKSSKNINKDLAVFIVILVIVALITYLLTYNAIMGKVDVGILSSGYSAPVGQ